MASQESNLENVIIDKIVSLDIDYINAQNNKYNRLICK